MAMTSVIIPIPLVPTSVKPIFGTSTWALQFWHDRDIAPQCSLVPRNSAWTSAKTIFYSRVCLLFLIRGNFGTSKYNWRSAGALWYLREVLLFLMWPSNSRPRTSLILYVRFSLYCIPAAYSMTAVQRHRQDLLHQGCAVGSMSNTAFHEDNVN